jgi:hypothetical protein
VDERIESLGRQVAVLRRLRACVQAPDAATAVPGVLSSAEVAAVSPLRNDGAA